MKALDALKALLAILAILIAGQEALSQTRVLGGAGGLSGVTSNGTLVQTTSTSGQFCVSTDTGLKRLGAGIWAASDCSTASYVAFGLVSGNGVFEIGGSGQYLAGATVGGTMDVGWKRGGAARFHASDGSTGAAQMSPSATASTTSLAGSVFMFGVNFEALGAQDNGTVVFCTNCTKATPCAGGGTGSLAKRIAGAWDCD